MLRTGGAFAGLMIVTLPRLRPAQLLCRGAGLPLYGTWLPGAARLTAALSQSAGGAGGGTAGSYGTHARQRQRRLDFYAKNGFLPCNLPVRLCGVALDVLTPGGQALDFAAYQGFYRPIFGRLAALLCKSANNAAGPNSPCILAGGGVE